MKRFLLSSIILLMLMSFSQSEKPKILIIGDSISIGYTPFVADYFQGKAQVTHNAGNAKFTANGLAHIEEWLGDEEFDIIQFNWGLWDLCYRDAQMDRDKVNGTLTASPEEYERNLRALVSILKERSDAKLIFVTTSYVPKEEPGRFDKDAQRYNKVAKRIMRENDIEVNDIYSWTKKIHKTAGNGPDDVHYSKEGYEQISQKITSQLQKALAERMK